MTLSGTQIPAGLGDHVRSQPHSSVADYFPTTEILAIEKWPVVRRHQEAAKETREAIAIGSASLIKPRLETFKILLSCMTNSEAMAFAVSRIASKQHYHRMDSPTATHSLFRITLWKPELPLALCWISLRAFLSQSWASRRDI